MKRIWGALIGVLGVALLAAASSAAVTGSGDICNATGSGTSYTLTIGIHAGAPQQFGFAFGAKGASVTNANIEGTDGTLSTSSVPANTTGAWLTQTPLKDTTYTVTLVTNANASGSFTVVPVGPSSTYLAPFTCTIGHGVALPSAAFTPQRTFVYDAKSSTWHERVTVPGAGLLSAAQQVSANEVAAPKPLIESSKVTAHSAGTFALALRLTGAGKTALAAKGSIKVDLSITFLPKDGRSTTKTLAATLRAKA